MTTSSSTCVLDVGSDTRVAGDRASFEDIGLTRVQGPWHITATGFPASKNDRTKSTASRLIRNLSGLATQRLGDRLVVGRAVIVPDQTPIESFGPEC